METRDYEVTARNISYVRVTEYPLTVSLIKEVDDRTLMAINEPDNVAVQVSEALQEIILDGFFGKVNWNDYL